MYGVGVVYGGVGYVRVGWGGVGWVRLGTLDLNIQWINTCPMDQPIVRHTHFVSVMWLDGGVVCGRVGWGRVGRICWMGRVA